MDITLWNDQTDTLQAMLDDAKEEARRLASAAIDDGGAEGADVIVSTILRRAWMTAGEPHQPLAVEEYRKAIDDIGLEDHVVAAAIADLNDGYLADETDNLAAIPLERPVVIEGTADLWGGSRTVNATVRFDTIGDILRQAPWGDMDANAWTIDEHDDLRYTGTHHDGVNTCTFRQLKTRGRQGGTRVKTEPLGPSIRKLYGIKR